MGRILDVPNIGVRTFIEKQPITEFIIEGSRVGGTLIAAVKKKFLKSEFQLVFEFINKVQLLRLGKITIASSIDMFLIKCLSKFELISLPTLMIEHMHKVVQGIERKAWDAIW